MKALQLFLSILWACMCIVCEAHIQFSRTFEVVDGVDYHLELTNGCKSKDKYGSNDCSFNWGDKIAGNVSAALTKELQKGSEIEVSLKIDRFIPFKKNCPVCGGKCAIEIPIIGREIEIPLPACPVKTHEISRNFKFQLPAQAPVEAKVSVDGTVSILDSSKRPVLEVHISALFDENRRPFSVRK